MGADAVGSAGANMNDPWAPDVAEMEAFQLGRTLAEAIETRRSDPEQEGVHEMMRAR